VWRIPLLRAARPMDACYEPVVNVDVVTALPLPAASRKASAGIVIVYVVLAAKVAL